MEKMNRSKEDELLMEKLVGALATFHHDTLVGFQKAEASAKITFDSLRKQVYEFNKSFKKGKKTYKMPLPSLEAIREEEGKGEEGENLLSHPAEEKKAAEHSKATAPKNKQGKHKKTKSSKISKEQQSESRIEENISQISGVIADYATCQVCCEQNIKDKKDINLNDIKCQDISQNVPYKSPKDIEGVNDERSKGVKSSNEDVGEKKMKGDGENVKMLVEKKRLTSKKPPKSSSLRKSKKKRESASVNGPLSENKENMITTEIIAESSPEKRWTRSKMAKAKQETDAGIVKPIKDEHKEKAVSPNLQEGKLNPKHQMKVKDLTSGSLKSQEKENHLVPASKNTEKMQTGMHTPLQTKNIPPSPMPSRIPLVSSAVKSKAILEDLERRKKEEEARRKEKKEAAALRNKLKIVKAKQEEVRRKNEEKMLKVAANREVVEEEKSGRLLKLEREREEKERAAKELMERKKEEATKKQIAQIAKVIEAEQRRLREEAARQANKEMEEEQRLRELHLKLQEETEEIMKQNQEEMRSRKSVEKAMQTKKPNAGSLNDEDNLHISEFLNNDEDYCPIQELPEWINRIEERTIQDIIHKFIPMDIILQYYACPSRTPDLTEFFGKINKMRVRSSSAIWPDDEHFYK